MARVDCIKERSRCDEKSLEGLTLSIKSITSLSKKKKDLLMVGISGSYAGQSGSSETT